MTYIIKSCLNNVEELKLRAGEQKRDFIHIDDVISIYQLLLEKAQQEPSFYQEYPVESGKAITVREFVEMIHSLTQSKTILRFGSLPYREGEIMFSEANLDKLKIFGWFSSNTLEKALAKTISDNINQFT